MKLRCMLPVLLLAAATGAPAQKVAIKGSNTFGEELAPRLVEVFRERNPDIAFELESKGSASGVLGLLDGTCDIGATSRALNEDEQRMARSRRITLKSATIGYYGVAVIVNKANPLAGLSDQQVRDLFTGAIANWREVGGADAPVHVYIRDPVSGTYLGFQELAMENKPYVLSARTFKTYSAIAGAVEKDPHGIGYAGMTLTGHANVKALRINGVPASVVSVADNLYPYARALRLYTVKGRESPETLAFLKFVRSTQGQSILDELGFVRRYQRGLPFGSEVP